MIIKSLYWRILVCLLINIFIESEVYKLVFKLIIDK
jgi:hypothetical protein